jgi:hypothetical protein
MSYGKPEMTWKQIVDISEVYLCLLDVFDLQIKILVGRDKDRTTVVLVHLMEQNDDASES